MAIYVNGVLVAGSGTGGTAAATGRGLPAGGAAGQVLAKKSSKNFDAQWIDSTGGGFVEMAASIPTAQRKGNTLYGLILEEYT